MEVLANALRVTALSAGAVAGLVAGLSVYQRMEAGRTFWHRLPWLAAALLILIMEFVLVVEWRCALGLINESECPAWR